MTKWHSFLCQDNSHNTFNYNSGSNMWIKKLVRSPYHKSCHNEMTEKKFTAMWLIPLVLYSLIEEKHIFITIHAFAFVAFSL